MNNENKTSVTGGVGFIGLLQILFIALKLTHVIDWKWAWVLAPLWIDAGLMIVLLVGFLIYIKR